MKNSSGLKNTFFAVIIVHMPQPSDWICDWIYEQVWEIIFFVEFPLLCDEINKIKNIKNISRLFFVIRDENWGFGNVFGLWMGLGGVGKFLLFCVIIFRVFLIPLMTFYLSQMWLLSLMRFLRVLLGVWRDLANIDRSTES